MSILINRNALSKGWKCFYIMHKDRRVATIRENGNCTIYFPSFMPYSLYLEKPENNDLDTRLNNLNNFYHWCSSRVLTLDRKYAKEIMNSIGASQSATDKDRAMIAISYHGLCLTDVYWIKGADEKLSFSDINLYQHSLSDAFASVSLAGKQFTAQNAELLKPEDAAGDVSTNGVAPKAWVRENGKFYLLKDGDIRDVEAELLASKIVGCFDVERIEYEPSEFDGRPVSKSAIITSEEQSIVSMEYVDVYCTNRGIDAAEFVLKKDSYSYYMMNVIDYLVGNTDRHWANWGFTADNRTNKLMKLHPLMDFNKAFLSYDTVEGARCQTAKGSMSQKDAAIEAVRKNGLHLIAEVSEEWFADAETKEMFFKRLEILKQAAR